MLGNPRWFKRTSFGVGLRPATLQGWLATAGWGAFFALPALALAGRGRGWESLIWLAFSGWMCSREIRGALAEFRREELFVIDEDTDVSKLATRHYDLEVRR